jgi:putative membrane protein
MTQKLLSVSLFSLAIALQSHPGSAQQQTPQPGQSDTQPRTQPGVNSESQTSPQNRVQGQSSQTSGVMTATSFLEKAAMDSQKEIDMSRLAATRAESSKVKSYAEDLIDDHTKSLDKIQKYSSKHNLSIRTSSTSGTSGNSSSTSSSSTSSTAANRSNTDTTTSTNANTNTTTNSTAEPRTGNRSNTTTQAANEPAGAADKSEQSTRPEALALADDSNLRELSSKTGGDFDQAYVMMMIDDHEKAIAMFEQQRNASTADGDLRDFVDDTLSTLRKHLSKAKDLQETVMNDKSRSTTSPSTARPSNENSPATTPSTAPSTTSPSPTTTPSPTSPSPTTPTER